MALTTAEDVEKIINVQIMNGWQTSGFTHLTDVGLLLREFHLIPDYLDMTPVPVDPSFARAEGEDKAPLPALNTKLLADMYILNAGWISEYAVPIKLQALALQCVALAAENGMYDVKDRREFIPTKVTAPNPAHSELIKLAGKIEVARATMLWWAKFYNVWNTRHTLPAVTEAVARYVATAADVKADELLLIKDTVWNLLYRVMHPIEERIILMFHPAGKKSSYRKAYAAASGRGVMGTKVDRFVGLRSYTLPEGTHRVTLALVFFNDLLTTGAFAVMPPELQKLLDTATLHADMIQKDPVSYHSNADFWGVVPNQIDTTVYDDLMPYMNSYYTVTKTRPTMLQNPRIAKAGRAPDHAAIVAASEATKPEVIIPVRRLTITQETLDANRERVTRAILALRA